METRIEGRMQDQARMFDPVTSSPTNVQLNTIRWNSASKRDEKWNGTNWIEKSDNYSFNAITVTSNLPTKLNANSFAWGSQFTVVDFAGNSGALAGSSAPGTLTYLSSNLYLDSTSNPRHKSTGPASAYLQIGGSHIWTTYISASAGQAATEVEALHVTDGRMFVKVPTGNPAFPTGNNFLSFSLVNDTSIKLSVKGSDGITRSTTLTLS